MNVYNGSADDSVDITCSFLSFELLHTSIMTILWGNELLVLIPLK